MYSGSKSGSKSFDELDDLLSASSEKNKKPKKSKTMSSENTSRHSCDELMMTRSLHEAETSDTGSQVSIFYSKKNCKPNLSFPNIWKKNVRYLVFSIRAFSIWVWKKNLGFYFISWILHGNFMIAKFNFILQYCFTI